MLPAFDGRVGQWPFFEVGVLHTRSARAVYHLCPLQASWSPVTRVDCSSTHMMPESNVHPDSRKVAEFSKIGSHTQHHANYSRKLQMIRSQLCILRYGLIDHSTL